MENAENSKAMQILEKSAYSEGQLHAYQNFWYTIHSERVLEESGRTKGLTEGLEKGRAEGRAEVARNLMQLGMAVADIAKATGLTIAEIEAL